MKRERRARRRLPKVRLNYDLWTDEDFCDFYDKHRPYFDKSREPCGFYVEKVVLNVMGKGGSRYEGVFAYFYYAPNAVASFAYTPGFPFERTMWDCPYPLRCDDDNDPMKMDAPHRYFGDLFRKELPVTHPWSSVRIESVPNYSYSCAMDGRGSFGDEHKRCRLTRAFAYYGSFFTAFFKPQDLQ